MGWMIYDNKENPICNFYPEVNAAIDAYRNGKAKPIPYIKLRLDFGGDQLSKELTIPLSELDEIGWFEKDRRCRFYPEAPQGKVRRYVADAVRSALPTIPTEKIYYVDRVGVHVIDSEVVFNTGGKIIRPPPTTKERPVIELEAVPYNLDIDPDLTEEESVAGMLELISLSPNPERIILAHKLLYIMKDVYKEVWKAPCVCIFLYGKTGTKKTTISTILTQMYNRGKGLISPVRLDASIPAAVDILTKNQDVTVILDDLYPADSSQIRGKQEQTLIEITRYIGDGTVPARMRGKHVSHEPPECGVLFTGEYLVGGGSSAARLLPVKMMPPDGKKLKYFQDNPLIVSTFYYYYIKWFIENYSEILDLLTEWRIAYSEVHLGVHDRLKETHFFLNTAYTLLLQYCCEKGFISEQDAGKLHHSFLNLLTTLVREQEERVNQNKLYEPTEIDYISRINTLFKGNQFIIADSAMMFNDDLHDGVIHNGCLWLRGKKLSMKFPNANLSDITDSLLSKGALRPSKNSRTNQISSLKGKRFYVIPLDKLR